MSWKSLHQSGRVASWTCVPWAIWVEMVIFLIVSLACQHSHFWSLQVVFKSVSISNHHSRYLCRIVDSIPKERHSYRGSMSLRLILWGRVNVLTSQSTCGFHFCSQGISKITCLHPRLSTISWMFSLHGEKIMSTWVSHMIFPLELVVPSTL